MYMDTKSKDPSRPVRNRHETETALNLAFEQLQSRGEKLSISGLARAAGVSASLIHNRYPILAERVRSATGKDVRSQRDEKEKLLVQEQLKNKDLRTEIDDLRKKIIDLASINESLRMELALQLALATGKVSKLP